MIDLYVLIHKKTLKTNKFTSIQIKFYSFSYFVVKKRIFAATSHQEVG